MRYFRWLSGNRVPPAHDLRRFGWSHDDRAQAGPGTWIAIATVAKSGMLAFPDRRDLTVLLGVADSIRRARLLAAGFGEVVGPDIIVDELAMRADRLLKRSRLLPRERLVSGLRLDLLTREAYAGRQALGLYPREFALLWRLAEEPGEPVSKRALLSDVWELGFEPETNSLAVHVSRLRRKLADQGITRLIETEADGGYRLSPSAFMLHEAYSPLDSHVRPREDRDRPPPAEGNRHEWRFAE